ncbi:DUF937 domain-containing protein [Stappia sp. ICDLI1TA098]
MSDSFPSFGAFDPASVNEAMKSRFGWSEAEIRKAAEALMPAALAGIRHFGSTPSGFEALMALMPGPGRVSALPPGGFVGEPLAFIFGPEDMRRRVAEYVAEQTGLEIPGIETMMPVAATLALGQVARRFTVGPARDLLDAFLSGYARGRPKPVPNPMRMIAPYADAMRSFWDGYMGLFSAPDGAGDAADVRPQEDNPAEDAGTLGTVAGGSETPVEGDAGSSLVESWLALGRDIQDHQVRQFEGLFDRADGPSGTR